MTAGVGAWKPRDLGFHEFGEEFDNRERSVASPVRVIVKRGRVGGSSRLVRGSMVDDHASRFNGSGIQDAEVPVATAGARRRRPDRLVADQEPEAAQQQECRAVQGGTAGRDGPAHRVVGKFFLLRSLTFDCFHRPF